MSLPLQSRMGGRIKTQKAPACCRRFFIACCDLDTVCRCLGRGRASYRIAEYASLRNALYSMCTCQVQDGHYLCAIFCALKCVSAITGSFAARSCEWLRVEAFAAGMPGVVSIQPPTGRLRVAPGLKELEKRMLFPAVLRATACWEICARAGLVPLRPAVFGRQWTKQNKFCIWL